MRLSLRERRTARPQALVKRIGSAPMLHAGVGALWVAGLLLLLTWTLIAHSPRMTADFVADAWLTAHQADSLRQGFLPSLFLTSDLTAFYPVFAFYGGTLFTFSGTLALLVGSAATAEIITYVLVLGAAYGGWLWLARMAGLRSWRAHAPAVIYLTAPYLLTNMYIRQDLAEITATSMIPVLLASTLSVLRADRLHAGPAAALAASAIVLGGSHNLTLLWGTTLVGLTVVGLLAGVPQARQLVSKRGLLRVAAVLVPALAVNAWYLLPDLAYQSHTAIAQRVGEWAGLVRGPSPEISFWHLFTLSRPGAGAFALPVLAMAWVVVASLVARRRLREAWGRTLLILSLATVVVLVVMTQPALVGALPDPWLMIQFRWRLETYVLFGICGATIAALVLVGPDAHRWLTWLLVPIMLVSVIGAARQVRNAPLGATDTQWSVDSLDGFNIGDYADAELRRMPLPSGTTPVVFVRKDVHRGRIDATVSAQRGEVIYTSLMAHPEMLDIQGAHVVGGWPASGSQGWWQPRWCLVLKIDDDTPLGQAKIVIREARSLPIVSGKILSLLGLLGLLANVAVIGRARRRRRRQPPPCGPPHVTAR